MNKEHNITTYSTSQIAKIIGLHPNTVRMYEEWGLMPPVMQKIVSIFPLTQGIELMKSAFLGLPMENAWLPVVVMVAVTVICTGIAVKFFKWE